MEVALSYGRPSAVTTGDGRARVRLAGARERPRLRYRGAVKEPLAFRDALTALHDVVIADLRWRPPQQREQFRRWLMDRLDREAEAERARLDAGRRRFFEHVWRRERDLGDVLDPVVSVHPDQVSFEALSRDGSTYGRVGLDRSALDEPAGAEVVCGTTNVDFSAGLYEAVRRLRTIWRTELDLGGGEAGDDVAVAAGAKARTEKKVELPEAWVHGFVQIGAASLLDAVRVDLLPVHLYDLLRHLKLRRARQSPRALRWELRPGRPVELVLEPWETRSVLAGSSHGAAEERIVRVWGRRRLLLLERVLPLAERFTVHLLGRGLPYFVTARTAPELGLDFTLGLSGWTKADWTRTARFDALVARRGLGGAPSPRPLAWLAERRLGTPGEVAEGTGLDEAAVHASLVEATRRGQVVYDLLRGVYRHRPLFGDLPEGVVLGADPREQAARDLVAGGAVVVTGTRRELDGTTRVVGRATEDPQHVFAPEVALADDGRVARATCDCWFAKEHGLKQGLCAHAHGVLLVHDG